MKPARAGSNIHFYDCWTDADRRATPYGSAADLAKAAECVANGDPTLLAVMDAEGKRAWSSTHGLKSRAIESIRWSIGWPCRKPRSARR